MVVVEELHVEQTVHLVATSQHSDEDRQGREGDTQTFIVQIMPSLYVGWQGGALGAFTPPSIEQKPSKSAIQSLIVYSAVEGIHLL